MTISDKTLKLLSKKIGNNFATTTKQTQQLKNKNEPTTKQTSVPTIKAPSVQLELVYDVDTVSLRS